MTAIQEKRQIKIREINKICDVILAEINVSPEKGRDFIHAMIHTILDDMGYIAASLTFYEAIAELAVVLVETDTDTEDAFSKSFLDMSPKDLYKLYNEQLMAAVA